MTSTLTAPAHWVSYLMSGTKQMMDDCECRIADRYLECYEVVDVVKDSKRFTWCYDKFGGDAQGGEVIDFKVVSR